MNKFLLCAVLPLIIFIGCALTPVPVQNPVCPQEGSWICEKSSELGIQPEQVYSFIYDATAIAAISDIVDLKQICDFEKKIAEWYSRVYPVSYDSLINEVLSRVSSMPPEKSMLIMNILNKHLLAYQSPALVSVADDGILRKGHVAFQRDFMCY